MCFCIQEEVTEVGVAEDEADITIIKEEEDMIITIGGTVALIIIVTVVIMTIVTMVGGGAEEDEGGVVMIILGILGVGGDKTVEAVQEAEKSYENLLQVRILLFLLTHSETQAYIYLPTLHIF